MADKDSGIITNIQKLSLDDGPGIRTTVFLKGCPLHCLWCHNPENISAKPQIAYAENLCQHCFTCVNVCPRHCYTGQGNTLSIEWSDCLLPKKECSVCVDNCMYDALTLKGKRVNPEEILRIVLQDKDFYEESGGGVSLSGGEPLFQPEFTKAVLLLMKKNGIHTVLDTCGFALWETLEQMLPLTDLFLYDLKSWNEEQHKQLTGVSNVRILENLKCLDHAGARIRIRIPLIKDQNDSLEDIKKMSEFLGTLSWVELIEVLPYHTYGIGKYKTIGKQYEGERFKKPENEVLDTIKEILLTSGKPVNVKPD